MGGLRAAALVPRSPTVLRGRAIAISPILSTFADPSPITKSEKALPVPRAAAHAADYDAPVIVCDAEVSSPDRFMISHGTASVRFTGGLPHSQ